MKTKLGVSVSLFSAGIYLAGFYGGVLASLLLLGYVLFFEESSELKTTAVRSTVLLFSFYVLSTLVGFVPDFINIINSFFRVFGGNTSLSFLQNIMSFVSNIIYLFKGVVFVVLAFISLTHGNMGLGPVDGLVKKHFTDI